MNGPVLFLLDIISRIPFFFFFFNDTATTEIYTLSLHDALPISLSSAADPIFKAGRESVCGITMAPAACAARSRTPLEIDRKSTRLNSSHLVISYAVFCLKKKKKVDKFHTPAHVESRESS